MRAMASSSASWRSGYAEDCKSLHPGSIPGEASNKINGLHS
jgi:protein-L-isoaspartate(D-aspartate) O-methyltransferase